MLLVEPKIKSTIDGKIGIEYAHEDVNIVIKGKKEEVKYTIRRNDLAKPNELAGVSGKIEGKMYIPYANWR